MLGQVSHQHQAQARALFILLYYTGRRPSELLKIKAADVKKDGSYVVLRVPTLKGGRFSLLMLPHRNPHIKEVYQFALKHFYEQYLFYAFKSGKTQRVRVKVKAREKVAYEVREYPHEARNVYYWVKKWSGRPPYFFRHNRFSSMAEQGADAWDIQHAKGSKDLKSVQPYQHLSKAKARKIARFIK